MPLKHYYPLVCGIAAGVVLMDGFGRDVLFPALPIALVLGVMGFVQANSNDAADVAAHKETGK
jgi:hypothetical protein